MTFRPLRSDASDESRNAPQNAPVARVAAVRHEAWRRRSLQLVAMFIVAGLVAIVAVTASGQQAGGGYDSVPLHQALEDANNVKRVKSAAKQYATTGGGNAGMVRFFYQYYVPAMMTAPDGIKNISDVVAQVNDTLVRSERSNHAGIAPRVTKYVLDCMKPIAEGNYHPSARINAALVLGRLNRTPANNNTKTPPVPLLNSLPVLMKLYDDENNVDGLRAAALQGIHRQVVYGFPQIPAAQKTILTTSMNSLLDSDAPANRPKIAHAFLQRYAVDIIDTLRDQEDKTLGVKLIGISTEPTKPSLIALYSASRIGSLGANLKGQVTEPKKVLKSWSKRALDAFDSEVRRLKALELPTPASTQPGKPEDLLPSTRTGAPAARTQAGGSDDMDNMQGMGEMQDETQGEGDMGIGGFDMGGFGALRGGGADDANPQPPEVLVSRMKLNLVLQQLHQGVTGSKTAGIPSTHGGLLLSVDADKKPVIEDWVKQMETIVTTLNDTSLDDREKYLEGIESQLAVLRELAGSDDEEVDANAIPGLEPEEAPAAANPLDDLTSQ